MNDVVVRPQTKFAAALLAAGVVSAASIVGVPDNRDLRTINVGVANASVITDALYRLGDAVGAVDTGVALPFYAALSLPFDATAAIAVAALNPSLTPSVLSWLVQRYVNPSDDYGRYTYPWSYKVGAIEHLANVLPYPVGQNVIDAINQIANAIGGVLAGLPSPNPGQSATNVFWDSDIGRTVQAASYAVTAPVNLFYSTVSYLGYLPANLEAAVEAAAQDPSKIPGLVSNLVYRLVSPSNGLLGTLVYYSTASLTSLPGPIGQLATNVVKAISNGIDGVLSQLPAPINPPRQLTTEVSTPSAATSVEANSVPTASLAVAGGITLKSVDPVEKKSETTDSTVSSIPATTPKDPAPVSTAVETDAPKTGVDTSVSDPVKSGNKVTPGDKFDNQSKGEPAKG
ncbi:MAG TPA: hypothetical protein VF477_12140, partial [Mycobacterium sp.]